MILAVSAVAVTVLVHIAAERRHGPRSPKWLYFSLGPPTGDSAHSNPTTLRGDGPTLRGMIAQAYGFPAVRVIGPAWLAQTRYTINATVGPDDEPDFRALLREELDRHLHLQTHVEIRPFDALVLRVAGAPRLARAAGEGPSIRLGRGDAQMSNVSMQDVARALQMILGKPIVNETGLSGTYDLALAWQEPRLETAMAALRDRCGLDLAPARVDMEALVIDHVRRDSALFFLSQAGRLLSLAPAAIRRPLADVLAID